MVHMVVRRTWALGSFVALMRNCRPMPTSCATCATEGPSKMQPKTKVAASRARQSSGPVFLWMFSWSISGHTVGLLGRDAMQDGQKTEAFHQAANRLLRAQYRLLKSALSSNMHNRAWHLSEPVIPQSHWRPEPGRHPAA